MCWMRKQLLICAERGNAGRNFGHTNKKKPSISVRMVIRAESWEKFRPALKKMKMSIVIQHETKKLAEISARSVERCIYTWMFPMEPKSRPQFRPAGKKPQT